MRTAGQQAANTLRQGALNPLFGRERVHAALGLSDFCETHNVVPNSDWHTVNLLGHTLVPLVIGHGTWWAGLADLAEPTALDVDTLTHRWVALYEQDTQAGAERCVDYLIDTRDANGDPNTAVMLVESRGVLRLSQHHNTPNP